MSSYYDKLHMHTYTDTYIHTYIHTNMYSMIYLHILTVYTFNDGIMCMQDIEGCVCRHQVRQGQPQSRRHQAHVAGS